MKEGVTAIEWTNPESRGYIDVFELGLFESANAKKGVIHPVVGRKGGNYCARCDVLVSLHHADLDYEAYPDQNNRWGMYLGIIRLTFSDKRREHISKVEWKRKGKKSFVSNVAKVVKNPIGKPAGYKLRKGNKKKARRDVVVRSGQAKFKRNLMVTQNGRCCISGCSIEQALEGAHIDPYYGVASDHPQNGLLLRRDLHALFDSDLLGIDPRTMKVYFANSIAKSNHYKTPKLTSLKISTYGGSLYAPSPEALARRWKKFKK